MGLQPPPLGCTSPRASPGLAAACFGVAAAGCGVTYLDSYLCANPDSAHVDANGVSDLCHARDHDVDGRKMLGRYLHLQGRRLRNESDPRAHRGQRCVDLRRCAIRLICTLSRLAEISECNVVVAIFAHLKLPTAALPL